MLNNKEYDILFLVDGGIGNVLEALYAVEYSIVNKKKTGVYIHSLKRSFVEFLRKGYGAEVILDTLEGVSTIYLLHSFTYDQKIDIRYQYYFYIQPDALSTRQLSETEQYLSVVQALVPSDYQNNELQFLHEYYSENVKKLNPENKIVIYPGGSAGFSSKRWPYYPDLINKIGEQETIIIGGTEDLNFEFSYYYPKWISGLSQKLLNARFFYNFCRKWGLLKKHAHFKGLDQLPNAYINQFSWEELVAIFRRCKYFIGNDGGLMHLAACCGTQGKAIFGPSSLEKNRAYNKSIVPVMQKFDCQPCSLGTKGINYSHGIIACPNQLRCQYTITPEMVLNDISKTNLTGNDH